MPVTLPRLMTLAATTALAMLPATAHARADTFVSNVDVPLDEVVTLTCGTDTIEDVHITGELHVLFHVTVDDAGGMHVDIHDNPHGTTGVGLTSGTAYHAVGSAQANSENNGPTDQMEISHQAVFGLISQGQAVNFDFVAVVHSTVNANGDVTVDLSEIRMECH
jgi:hypothetical protein